MSAKGFYQVFYQNDSIYRIPGEEWSESERQIPVSQPVAGTTVLEAAADLLADLDQLALGSIQESVSAPLSETSLITNSLPVAEVPLLSSVPEPLPEPSPRPTVPPVLPPIQPLEQARQLNQKVLLLADEELDPSNLLFLEKILKAVNLNIEGVDLLNLQGAHNMDFNELLRGKFVHHFITFGVPFERINLDIMMDRYSPVRFEGITFLMADSLPTIEADQQLKKRLWGALQRIFLR